MPRFVRNFWAMVKSDARKKTVETGPTSKDGGIDVRLLLREAGSISDYSIEIDGRVIVGLGSNKERVAARVSLVKDRTELAAFQIILPRDEDSKDLPQYAIFKDGLLVGGGQSEPGDEPVEQQKEKKLPKREGYWKYKKESFDG
jgi:hypothetical protein